MKMNLDVFATFSFLLKCIILFMTRIPNCSESDFDFEMTCVEGWDRFPGYTLSDRWCLTVFILRSKQRNDFVTQRLFSGQEII